MQFKIAKGILNYLVATQHYDLKYIKSDKPLKLFGFSDWANDIDFQSVSGYMFRFPFCMNEF